MNQQEQMYSLVKEWKQSDLTKAEFSALKLLSYHQFNYWLQKYNKNIDTERPPEVSFFSVADKPKKEKKQSSQKNIDQRTMRIDLPGGITITIY
jgi:hypothetical protein